MASGEILSRNRLLHPATFVNRAVERVVCVPSRSCGLLNATGVHDRVSRHFLPGDGAGPAKRCVSSGHLPPPQREKQFWTLRDNNTSSTIYSLRRVLVVGERINRVRFLQCFARKSRLLHVSVCPLRFTISNANPFKPDSSTPTVR